MRETFFVVFLALGAAVAHGAVLPTGDLPFALLLTGLFYFSWERTLLFACTTGYCIDIFSSVFGVSMAVYFLAFLAIRPLIRHVVTTRSFVAYFALALGGAASIFILKSIVFLLASPLPRDSVFFGDLFFSLLSSLLAQSVYAIVLFLCVCRKAQAKKAFLIIERSI